MLITLTLTHPDWADPVYRVSDAVEWTLDGIEYLPGVFNIGTPPLDESGRATLPIEIADEILSDALTDIEGSSDPVTVYVTWWDDDQTTPVIKVGPTPFTLHEPVRELERITGELRSPRNDDVSAHPRSFKVTEYACLRSA